MAVVVGYIPTKEGRAALREAAAVCRRRNTRLVVVSSARGNRSYDPEETRRLETALAEVTADLNEENMDFVDRFLVRGPEPGDEIVNVAREIDAELIVIGLRRRTPVGKLLLGSNAQRVLLEAPCPVLAVKAGEGD